MILATIEWRRRSIMRKLVAVSHPPPPPPHHHLLLKSPFEVCSKLSFRVWPDDLDINFHLNNSSYNKHCDYARLESMTTLFPPSLLRNATIANAGVVCWFKREIKPFQAFYLESKILTFDQKWFFLKHTFYSDSSKSKVHAIAISKLVVKRKNGITVPFYEALEQSGLIKQAGGVLDEETESLRLAGMTSMGKLMQVEQDVFEMEVN